MESNRLPSTVNLLYIEDDESIVDLVIEQLNTTKHTRFNIITKSTLKDGLDYLDRACRIEEECEIDAILLDLVLPNSSGVDTFLKVKSVVDFIPIVIVSAHEDIACKCVELGAQDYLVKPDISPALLIRSLKYSIHRNRTERKMRNVIMTSSLGYHLYELIDDKLMFVGYNPASNDILGVDNEMFMCKELNEAFPDLDPEVEKNYRLALKGTPWTNQRVEYGDQNIKPSTFRVNAYRTAENFLTVTFEDVTEKIKIENELKETMDGYKNLIEITGAGMYGIDFVNNRFTYVNDVMCRQLGYTRDELLNMGPTHILTDESIQKWAERFAALKRGEYIEDSAEYEARTKDGSTMWVVVTAQYIEDEDDNVIGANVVAIDITDRKTAQQALERKEVEVFSELEKKIHDWKEELVVKNTEKESRLQLIDAEIKSMTGSSKNRGALNE